MVACVWLLVLLATALPGPVVSAHTQPPALVCASSVPCGPLTAALYLIHAIQVLTEAHNATWPPYVRGKGQYVWGTSLSQRMRGFNFAGGNERLRRAMAKLLRGRHMQLARQAEALRHRQGRRADNTSFKLSWQAPRTSHPQQPHCSRNCLHHYGAGDPVLLSAVGGSITTGDIQKDGFPWPTYVNHYMTGLYT